MTSQVKMEFVGQSFEEVKVKIQEFAFYHLGMRLKLKGDLPKRPRGRPKMSAEEHLRPKDELTYGEVKELLLQVYEATGDKGASKALKEFHVERLSQMEKKHYERFKRFCLNLLQEQRAER